MNKFPGIFGMHEMEMAVSRIARTVERVVVGQTTIIDNMETDDERTGFVELLDNGWINSTLPPGKHYRYNGEFFVTQELVDRIYEKEEEELYAIKEKLLSTLGMCEMECCVARLVFNEEFKAGELISINEMETDNERIGFVELIKRDYLMPDDDEEGCYTVTKELVERLEDKL